jgi:hypothetical protein
VQRGRRDRGAHSAE